QGVFTRAAAGVQDRAGDPAGNRGEPLLRRADVPGCRPGIEVFKGGTVYRVVRYQVALWHGHDDLSSRDGVEPARTGAPPSNRIRSIMLASPGTAGLSSAGKPNGRT